METQNKVFARDQGTYMTENFIPKTSTILKKEFLKYINSKESNGSLKSFKSIKVQSYIHSYLFIF